MFGAYKGLVVTGTPVVAVVMGMLTGTLGGILRDVLANAPSVLLRREIHVTAALFGAVVFGAAEALGVGLGIAALSGLVAAFGLRACALVLTGACRHTAPARAVTLTASTAEAKLSGRITCRGRAVPHVRLRRADLWTSDRAAFKPVANACRRPRCPIQDQ